MNIKILEEKLWEEQRRLEKRLYESSNYIPNYEKSSLRGSILTIKKIIRWVEE